MGLSLDILDRLESQTGNPLITDGIFFEENAMKYARQGNISRLSIHGPMNFTYANRVARDECKQGAHFGEVSEGYELEDEFCDALVRGRQSQDVMTL